MPKKAVAYLWLIVDVSAHSRRYILIEDQAGRCDAGDDG